MSEDINVTDGTVLETLNNKVDIDLNNVANNSIGFARMSTEVTNCILEIPQRIKLELNNGVLTLKAGSEVIVPNGFEADGVTPKFDEVVIENDVTFSLSAGTVVSFIEYAPATNSLFVWGESTCSSGATQPTSQYFSWYDTTNNKMKNSSDSGASISISSFPIAKTNNTRTSIDQVFNGFGYIGSTVWVDKGVKGLIPNGRNEDGTCKNVEFTVPKIYLRHTDSSSHKYKDFTIAKTGIGISNHTLDNKENYLYNASGVRNIDRFVAGNIQASSTAPYQITSLQPKQPFRAVDYSDKSTVTSWGFPSNRAVTLSVGASGSVYTAPANGWFNARATITSGQYIEFTVQANGLNVVTQDVDSTAHTILCPVSKGQGVVFGYNATNITLRFIYAEGEV